MAKDKQPKKRSIFRAVIIVLMIIIIILLFCMQQCGSSDALSLEESIKAELGQLDGKTEEEILEELNRVVEEGMFHISINPDPVFADGTSEGNLEIENIPNNLYGMVVIINLTETEEEVYNSGLIYPNYHIQRDSLSVELEAGAYDAIATFVAYDLDSFEEIGRVSSEITIHILE